MAGDRFSERHEQEELQRFLARTDKVHGWPTESTYALILVLAIPAMLTVAQAIPIEGGMELSGDIVWG